MSLTKRTNLGIITINPSVISREVIHAAMPVNEKMFFATEKGKLLGTPKKIGSGELASNIKLEEKQGKTSLTVYIIMNFGSSIKNTTDVIFENLENSFKPMFPSLDGIITIKIVGVKSKNIAPRDIEVTREYEASRQS